MTLFGSWARGEYTEYSDDDFAVIFEGSPSDDEVRRALASARKRLGVDGRKPGSQEIFGVAFGSAALAERIGLDEDTNTNLTRRMLLLLESRPLTGRDVWERCRQRVLGAYLHHGVKHYRPPRFLLNDIVRYWRTIGVDFEGKHRGSGGDDSKWVTRNAKLRTSRKVLFAGGLLPVLLCHTKAAEEMEAYLAAHLAATPTDRLAAAFLALGAADEGARALGAYDDFLGLLREPAVREELSRLRADTRDESPVFQQIRTLGERLEAGLLALLFETRLAPVSRRYCVF